MKLGIDRRRKIFKQVIDGLGGELEMIICGGAYLYEKFEKGMDDDLNIKKAIVYDKDGVEIKGLRLKMASGQLCSNEENYQTIYEIACNPTNGKNFFNFDFSVGQRTDKIFIFSTVFIDNIV